MEAFYKTLGASINISFARREECEFFSHGLRLSLPWQRDERRESLLRQGLFCIASQTLCQQQQKFHNIFVSHINSGDFITDLSEVPMIVSFYNPKEEKYYPGTGPVDEQRLDNIHQDVRSGRLFLCFAQNKSSELYQNNSLFILELYEGGFIMKAFFLSLEEIFMWSLVVFGTLIVGGCFSFPMNSHVSDPILNSDYAKDIMGKLNFGSEFLRINPQVSVPESSPPYLEIIDYAGSPSDWEQGFLITVSKVPFEGTMDLFMTGIDPGLLVQDSSGQNITVNFYNKEGKKYYSVRSNVTASLTVNVNRNKGQYLQDGIRTLIFFDQTSGISGYTEMPPIRIKVL